MKIIYLPVQTWEPALLSFRFSSSIELDEQGEVIRHIEGALGRVRPNCSCKFVRGMAEWHSFRKLRFSTEWLCPKCLEPIMERIDASVGNRVQSVEVGLNPIDMKRSRIISIPDQTIKTQDGKEQFVKGFDILYAPVSVGQFRDFVEKAGYVTTAEKKGTGDTFLHNDTVVSLGKGSVSSCPALCMSYLDAMAFCEYTGYRLPTEDEWLSAAIYDWTEYDFDDPEIRLELSLRPSRNDRIWVGPFDLTATFEDERVVARCGPMGVLDRGWRNRPGMNRELFRVDQFSSETCFRVILPKGVFIQKLKVLAHFRDRGQKLGVN